MDFPNALSDPKSAAAAGTEELSTTVAMDVDEKEDPNVDENDGGGDDNDDNASSSNDDTASTIDVDNDNDDSNDDDKGVSPEEAERLLLQAANLKEQGNTHFTAKPQPQRDEAVRCYRRGLNRLKKLRRSNTNSTDSNDNDGVDPQVTALWVTLSTNLATVLSQLSKHRAAVAAATQALEVQPMHVKALYRRAVAQRQCGNAEQAVRDLQTALTVEPNHTACRKELRAVQTSIVKAQQAQKKALSKAFAAGVSLYEDKAGPKAPPTPEELEQALQEQKQQWEEECVQRMSKGEEAISFEDWQKEQTEKLEREKKEEEDRQKAEAKRVKEERKKAAAARKAARENKSNNSSNDNSSSDDDDDKLTEAELQALRGYKKTKDGRTTSYFTRELSPEEQAKLAAASQGPRKLSSPTGSSSNNNNNDVATPVASVADAAVVDDDKKKKGPSAWNRAGTWEEKDTTEWCTEHLKHCLLQVRTATSHIVKIDACTGDASIVWTKGQQRHVFDFHVTLQYAWTGESDDEDGENSDASKKESSSKSAAKRAKGIVKLPEISSTSTQEGLEVIFETGWKRQPATAEAAQRAVADRPVLEQALQEAVLKWQSDFHEHYRVQ